MQIKNFIYGLLSTALLLLCIWSYLVYEERALKNIVTAETTKNLRVEELIKLFQDNEDEANLNYVDKVIEVEGTIKDISTINDRYTILLKSELFTKHFIMCDMSPSSVKGINKLIIGDTITLKGICKGYLLDVIMLNCIPINEKSKN